MPPSLASTSGKANKDRSFHEAPEKTGSEGWLYSEQQQKLCHFKPDTATVHAQWVAISTYSYVPPRQGQLLYGRWCQESRSGSGAKPSRLRSPLINFRPSRFSALRA